MRPIIFAAMFSPVVVCAETVELTSVDGTLNVSADIVSVNDETVTITSGLGTFDVEIANINCEGDFCSTVEGWANAPMSHNVAITQIEFTSFAEGLVTQSPTNDTLTLEIVATPTDQTGTRIIVGSNSTAESTSGITWIGAAKPEVQLLGVGAWSVVVSPSAGVSSITREELAAIYAGEITNWSALGGNDVAVLPLKREPGSVSFNDFNSFVAAEAGSPVLVDMLTVGNDDDVVMYVGQFNGSVGVVDPATDTNDLQLAVLDQCGQPSLPTEFAIQSGSYALMRSLVAVHDAPAVPDRVVALFDEAVTGQAADTLQAFGYVPNAGLTITPSDKTARIDALSGGSYDGAQSDAAGELLSLMFTSTRLSHTFRGGDLDAIDAAWNRRTLIALADEIEAGTYDDREIMLVGFSGPDVAFAEGLSASQSRADEFLAGLNVEIDDRRTTGAVTAQIDTSAKGFGTFSEIACPVQGAAETIEVWTRPRSQ